jgi:putative heme-binding domain-containing protein
MSRTVALAAALAVCLIGVSSLARAQGPELVAPTGPRTPAEEKAGFHLPPGFEAQLVASEPTINKPMNLAFDDRGRLWVTSTVEYPWPVDANKKGRDRVVVLDDFAPDGRARKSSTFADGLNIPIGVLPLGRGDSALVHSIPAIRKYTDKDGDGKADTSEEMYSSFAFQDTHGMTNAFTWGFDGWIYACHGFANESKVKGADGQPIVMQSGNTYRMKPDGSHVEYFTHGQVNPFGLAFDPMGNLYSCDCHSRPIYCLLPGAYYPSFGKPDDGLGFGPEMLQHDHGSTGIAGIVYYAADQFPKDYQDRIYIGNVVTSRINDDKLKWTGSTPKAIEQPDFMWSDDPWFRPVDLELGPDGALYVADFYNKIIGHYEVPLTHPGRDRERGRIWRIVYTGKDATAKPLRSGYDGTKESTAELVADLGNANLVRRIKAANILVERGQESVGPVKAAKGDPSPVRRAHALWVLQRLGAFGKEELRSFLDKDELVRVHVTRILGERSPSSMGEAELLWLSGNSQTAGLKDPSPFVRRAVAEAMGRHPGPNNIGPLVGAISEVPPGDDNLKHALRISLRDQLLPLKSWWLALSDAVGFRRVIADISPGVPNSSAAFFLTKYLANVPDTPANKVRYIRHIARYGQDADQQELDNLILAERDPGLQVAMLKAVNEGEQARGAGLTPELVIVALDVSGRLLRSTKDSEFGLGIDLVGATKLREFGTTLISIVADPTLPESRRDQALVALAATGAADLNTMIALMGDPVAPPALRDRAAGLLAATSRPEAFEALIQALPTSPGKLQAAIAAGLAKSPAGGERLLQAIEAGKGSARLLQERGVSVPLAGHKLKGGEARVAALLKGLPPAEERIQAVILARRQSYPKASHDLSKGEALFTKNCASCHILGGKGARVGPQLDGVGIRGVERLLEDVLDPNRNVDQAFRTTSLSLKDGRVISGLLLREEGQVLVLADAQGKDVRVPKADVEERMVSQLSPMPANWSEQIPEVDFPSLLAYLLAQKPKDGPAPGR